VVAEMYPNIDNWKLHRPYSSGEYRNPCGARKDKVYTRPQFTSTLTRCAIRMDRFAKHESHQLLYGVVEPKGYYREPAEDYPAAVQQYPAEVQHP
jgi:putative SOS response-associated peptidase YedK